jgi:glycosyltransferase involved in cell wall biosynthesis
MDKINILFAPSNTANMPDITMQALNKLDGVAVKGISVMKNQYWNFGKGWYITVRTSWKKAPFYNLKQLVYRHFIFIKLLLWADIIIWNHFLPKEFLLFNFEYYIIKIFKKKLLVEWIGGDIRNPEYVFKHNKYYKKCWEDGEYDYTIESKKRSLGFQKIFKTLNAIPLLAPEMSLFLDKTIYPSFELCYQRINLADFKPVYPRNPIPVIVHTPSSLGAKGTKYVREAVNLLKSKNIAFKYIEIHNQSRSEALNAISKCDLFIDQFIYGGYGLACCEAMAMGKPVFCYLMEPVVEVLPKNCPIINTNLDNLDYFLEKYILDAALRYDAGVKSREYAEKYHDADKIAVQLKNLFKKILNKN